MENKIESTFGTEEWDGGHEEMPRQNMKVDDMLSLPISMEKKLSRKMDGEVDS